MGNIIKVIAGDRGGWNALEPELLEAADAGYEIHPYFVGICEEHYTAGKLKPDPRFAIQSSAADDPQVATFFKSPHALNMLGASQSNEGAHAAFTAALNSPAPQLAVQDLYGSFIPTLALLKQSGQEKRVDCICVTDQFARDQILNQGYNLQEHIVITGGPHFDKALALKKSLPQRRDKIRGTLNVTDQETIFLIAGQLNGTDEVVALLVQAIIATDLAAAARIIIRAHPRATDSDIKRTAEAVSKMPSGMLLEAGQEIAASTDDLLPAADFVLSGYSTTNTFGILY